MQRAIHTVIVSRDFRPLLHLCLRELQAALQRVEGGGHRITLVDNASLRPYRPDEFPGLPLRILRRDTHGSFSTCCNFGMEGAGEPYQLMLNNDVLLHPESLARALAVMAAHPRFGMVAPRLVYPNGTIQHCGILLGGPEKGPWHAFRGRPSEEVSRALREFQAVSGAALLMRAEMLSTLGGFDEAYPYGYEDVDLCLRARQAGWGVAVMNEVDSIHFESQTPGRETWEKPSRDLFMQRWLGKWMVDHE